MYKRQVRGNGGTININEMESRDWSSDVCSSDLLHPVRPASTESRCQPWRSGSHPCGSVSYTHLPELNLTQTTGFHVECVTPAVTDKESDAVLELSVSYTHLVDLCSQRTHRSISLLKLFVCKLKLFL